MYNAAAEYYRLSQKDKATPEDLKRLQSLERLSSVTIKSTHLL